MSGQIKMFNLLNKFRFTANDGSGDTTVTPVNTGLRKRWELQENGVSYRVTLGTELVFRGADYTYFKDILDAAEECSVTLLIEQFCSPDWTTFFEGKILPTEGKYDLDKWEVSFKVVPDDVYECAKNNFSKQTNWLDYGTAKTLKAVYGEIQTENCSFVGTAANVLPSLVKDCWSGGTGDFQFGFFPDPATAWTPVTHNQSFADPVLTADTVWKREYVNQPTQPPGYGWINIGGDDWVRPVTIISYAQEFTATTYDYEAVILDDTFEVSNGRFLSAMLEGAADATGCNFDEVRSQFFGINADGATPSNTAYDYARDDEAVMQSVLIFQKSDIVNADATNDATILNLSLNDFLTALRDSLNVYWAIVEEGGDTILRIEHLSYFEGAAGFDLTTLDGGKYIRGLNRYEIDGEIPPFERFAYQESINPEFQANRIEYTCPNGSEIDRQLSQMCADFGGLLNNENAGLEGFVFVCAYPITGDDYLMDNTDGMANGAMMWKHLFNNLWVFGRYSLTATSTAGGTFTVETLKKRKAQAAIQIPFCCESFEPTETVETALGLGMVRNAEQDTEAGILTLNLLHE